MCARKATLFKAPPNKIVYDKGVVEGSKYFRTKLVMYCSHQGVLPLVCASTHKQRKLSMIRGPVLEGSKYFKTKLVTYYSHQRVYFLCVLAPPNKQSLWP